MKILMSLIICSSIAGECMPPYEWPETFRSKYDCLHFGYEESQKKLEEIGMEITVFQFELDKKGKLNKNSINNKYVMLRSGNKDSVNLIENDEL